MKINWTKIKHAIRAARKASERERRMMRRCLQRGGRENPNYDMIRREYIAAYKSTLQAFMA